MSGTIFTTTTTVRGSGIGMSARHADGVVLGDGPT